LEVKIEELVVEINDLSVRGELVGLSSIEVEKARSKSNLISAIRVEDRWVDTPNLIKVAVSSYFEKHVSATP
jgi:hypothetical protein